jgi:EAL and modified HD-GYP domain-containing signal transduction protein
VVESAEREDYDALAGCLAALQIEAAAFNRIAVDAIVWMQSVAAGKAGSPHA